MLLAASVARTASAGPADDVVSRPLTLEAGELEAQLALEAELAVPLFQPLAIAPDVWFGVTRRLTLGIIHSDPSLNRIQASASFCVRQSALECDRFYEGSGVDARYLVLDDGAFSIAPRVRAYVRGIDPVKPSATFGATLKYHHRQFAIESDPYLRFSLANAQLGNRGGIVVPLYLEWQPASCWLVFAQTGWDADYAVISDGWHIPFGLGVTWRATRQLDVGAEFGLTTALGPQNDAKQRVAFVTVAWRSRAGAAGSGR